MPPSNGDEYKLILEEIKFVNKLQSLIGSYFERMYFLENKFLINK